jgi:DHA2 family multidrug resistance protein
MAVFAHSMSTQAATLRLNDIFWLSAVIFVAIIPLIWVTRPGKANAAAVTDGAH